MNCLFKNMRTMCLAMIAGTLLLTVSCKDDDEATVTGFALDQTEVGFLNHGGAIEIRVATDETWTAISENDWCMLTPANGVGSVVCVIKADSSYLYKERYGKITFYSESGKSVEVAINQMGYEPTIQLTSEEVTIPSYAELDKSYIDIEATSNVAFEVVAPEDLDWLTLEGESKYTPSTTIPRKQKFRFRFKTYTEFDKVRSAQIKFNQTGKPITRAGEIQKELLKKIVTITQEKAPLIIPSREGDSLALLAMSRTLNLDGSGWVTSRPITHWNNVETEERTYHYSYGDIDKDSTEVRVISLRFSMFDTKESVPYQIKYLTELESFSAVGNSNAFTKKIVLGPEITTLKNLKSLSLMGYGISEFPPEMKNMTQLEELDMNGNNFLKLPMDILKGMTGLKYLNFGGNRVSGSVLNLQTDIPKKYTDVLGTSVKGRLNTLVHNVIINSVDRPVIQMSEEVHEAMQGLRVFMFENVYRNPVAKKEEGKAIHMITNLYEFYIKNPEFLPEQSQNMLKKGEELSQVVCDYIAGMTDTYAVKKFTEFFIPESWKN